MAKRQTVHGKVVLVVRAAVVQESPNSTLPRVSRESAGLFRGSPYKSTMGVNDNNQPIELSHSVDIVGANRVQTLLDIPQVEAAAAVLLAIGTEFKVHGPLLIVRSRNH